MAIEPEDVYLKETDHPHNTYQIVVYGPTEVVLESGPTIEKLFSNSDLDTDYLLKLLEL